MLKNKPELPRIIKDYEGHNQYLSIEFREEFCYI